MHILLIYLEPLNNEPLGLMYIGTILKKEGYSVKIIGLKKRNNEKHIFQEIYEFRPSVVGISITTPLADIAQKIACFIKKRFPHIIVVAGGPHPTILPYETLKEKNIDICVIGEGELTIIELLRIISEKKDLRDVKGIAYLETNKLIITPQQDFIEDLDSLPFIDRELMPKSVIYGRAGYPLGNPCMLIIIGRGCPFNCSFCQPTIRRMFGAKLRRRSVENVIEEIVQLKTKYGINGLWITDDTFLVERSWVERFCDYLIKKNIDILWYANGRLNNPDEEILKKMYKSGCRGLVMTPESGSQRIRNEILNKGITDEEIFKAYRICKKIGLPFQANIMLATPTETEEELKSSLSLIKKIQPHFMNLSYTTALPGTYLYERYFNQIKDSLYYRRYSDFDIGRFKKLDCQIEDKKIKKIHRFFEKYYDKTSFRNRARHFLKYPYFRRILYRRWKTLLFSKYPKFLHLGYDIISIILGIIPYIINKNKYKE
ncbi:MAG: B12-binding domain-containing radical SAM protein [Candidatus Omnitrophica bacterium]|nr:B12-binding domain-containing radical SAM protein [Candidatus Omnitrophota bacterium]